MIITKTPFRISFFGGGTDFVPWYTKHGGMVLSTTINKYCYISVRRLPAFFDYKHRIVYSNIELVKSIDDIKHPSVRETLRYLKMNRGIEVQHNGDLPARSGLGSSSSFTVGLVHAIRALDGKQSSKEELAKSAIEIEQKMIGEACGSQDQVAAAHGGFNRIVFNPDGSISVEPIIIPDARLRELENGLCLFYTGVARLADEIEKDKQSRIEKIYQELKYTKLIADDAYDLLCSPNFSVQAFGRMLGEAWDLKKRLSSKVSSADIDDIYEKATNLGAYGGKILGAGGGGFMLFVIEPWMKDRLIEGMHPLVHVPFKFSSEGSRIALYSPNGL